MFAVGIVGFFIKREMLRRTEIPIDQCKRKNK